MPTAPPDSTQAQPDRAPARPALTPQLLDTGVVAILRARSARHVPAAVDALVGSGVTCLEVTLTIPGAMDAIRALTARLPAYVSVGAGTVTSVHEAAEAVAAGARFVVSPVVRADVIACAAAAGIPCYAGAWTPTEVLTAWQAGASAVKVFPAASGGPRHLRSLREPLPGIPLVPTGGIGVDDVHGYIAAGAAAVGMGGPLLGNALDDGDMDGLRARASSVLARVAAARDAR
ncbi:bifunctional 4-hydroxy-2-oxoglutarate aldolase/2-dehydro-3-deoxy-phosphogluconate aldolase [Streptomyces sp.]|uniref:bifunctional 4-hydroxy-2-oxoglutarate aldolase/2-dehydro-3-deoxy-phosphogluconate aldolase n=1 Tax=Streptomyces sp. TaxID=1931 RepID=UPI002F42D7C1